ncbi:MAG: hypothetical protein DSY55_01800, partial [Clostridia bacterium]
IFQAVGDFKAFNITTISRLGWMVCFLTILFFLKAVSIMNVIVANVMAETFTFFIILLLLRRHTSFSGVRYKPHSAYLRDTFQYGIKVYISSIFTVFNYKQDRFILNAYLSPASVGVYNIGANLGEKLWLISQSVSTVLFPKIASLEDDEDQRRWMTPFIARHVFMGTAIASIALFFVTPFLVQLFYGAEFIDAASVLRIMLPGIVFLTISRIVSNDIAGRGRPGINTLLSGIAVLINLIANILLIPKLGIRGAAWASTISYSINAFLKIGAYSYIAKVNWSSLFILRSSDFEIWRRLMGSLSSRC